MYEVELKLRAGHDPVRDRLVGEGGKRLGTVRQVDTYYDAPDRDFAETDEALRVRQETDEGSDAVTTTVTYKGPLVDPQSKTREEAEMEVTAGSEPAAVLDGLGYEPAATVEKVRERYVLDGVTVTLDTVEGLGEFVEVELPVETVGDGSVESGDGDEGAIEPTQERTIERARERAIDVLETLDLDADEQVRTSYLGLLLEG